MSEPEPTPPESVPATRRAFLRGAAAAAAAFGGLARYARALEQNRAARAPGLGPLVPDPAGGLELPRGFRARAISVAGEAMDDGLVVPPLCDGMAAFPGPGGLVLIVRNHELEHGRGGAFGPRNERLLLAPPERLFDRGRGRWPCLGGTTTLVWDPRSETLLGHHLSLAGTHRNCAGGPTPWGSWISCEESVARGGWRLERDHGWAFEVPAAARGLVEPRPLEAMGRFYREAVAVDARTGIVYQTEDRPDGLLYRFVPRVSGHLERGGRLQALAVRGRPGLDARNWDRVALPLGGSLPVRWVDLDEPAAPGDDLRHRGREAGATTFTRGEGLCAGAGAIWFTCTDGGRARLGQVWRYVPEDPETGREGRLELFLEPNDARVLQHADNLTVAPWGDLVLCEDAGVGSRVLGVTPAGRVYPIARNVAAPAEFAGATFSPDGSTLFVNLQQEGRTFAILGPWERRRA